MTAPLRILFLDDEKHNLGLYPKMLEKHGFEVVSADYFGFETMSDDELKSFDAAITDLDMKAGIDMPEGVAVRNRMLSVSPNTPVFLWSASFEATNVPTLQAPFTGILKNKGSKAVPEMVEAVNGYYYEKGMNKLIAPQDASKVQREIVPQAR